MNENIIISLSGGKDSTAMLLRAVEENIKIYAAVFFDTGWEYPAMHRHIEKLKKDTGVRIFTLRPRVPFEFWMTERPVRERGKDGKIYAYGRSWPTPQRRWCTTLKTLELKYFYKQIENPVAWVGYAADEMHRSSTTMNSARYEFPLQTWGMSEDDCLKYCYDRGYDWEGIYNHIHRVSCYCCPLQRKNNIKYVHDHHPELWGNMLRMDDKIQDNRGFWGGKTVKELDRIFKEDQKQDL